MQLAATMEGNRGRLRTGSALYLLTPCTMKREIKFRMWSGAKMLYDLPSVMECMKQQMAVWQGADPMKSLSTIAYDHVSEHNASFMQYTGMNDHMGKEIYEGDIVDLTKHMGAPEMCNKPKVVKWDHVGAKWSGIYPMISGWQFHYIIGNVYENPELIP